MNLRSLHLPGLVAFLGILSLVPTFRQGIDSWTTRPVAAQEALSSKEARWIWAYPDEPAPKNRFTYFRKVVQLDHPPQDGLLHLAADSNAQLWVNGHLLRRKVSRYFERHITTEVVDAGPYLKVGANVVVLLHHNWGPIIAFQRSGNDHAGLYLDSEWVKTDETWRCLKAPEFLEHDQQIVGIAGNAPRIRYPQILDARKSIQAELHLDGFDDSHWRNVSMVKQGPWPDRPEDVETPGQREYPVTPPAVLAAGDLVVEQTISEDPYSIATGIATAKCLQDDSLTQQAKRLVTGKGLTLDGKAGTSRYLTFDFQRPVHGYPFLEWESATEGTIVDFGYCEIARSLYSGKAHVTADGWINPVGVVGKGYADRMILDSGPGNLELPDERTARWMTLHVHFPQDGSLTLAGVGIVKSQYPIDPVGSFECGDPRIDQIVRLCLDHAEITMSDSYVDTPGREDGQWIEDARPRAQLAARWFGDIDLRRFLIRTVAQSQGEGGNFHPFPPSNYPAYPAPYDWSVQWVACLYDDYLWTGKTDLIEKHWDVLQTYWAGLLKHLDDEGVWFTSQVLADIRIGVHPSGDRQSSGMVTPWIIQRLRWSAEMARSVGHSEVGSEWDSTAQKMETAFRRVHLVPAEGEIPLHVADRYAPDDPAAGRGFSQSGQTLAISMGLLAKTEALALLDYAFAAPDGTPPASVTRWNNPTYGYRVLKALSSAGRTDRAVAHLIERYSPYLPGNTMNRVPAELQGPWGGPLPEYWVNREDLGLSEGEINTAQPDDETGSHGWGAVPLLWLHDSLLGVEIVEAGGGSLRIAPEDGGLPYVAGYTMTPKGPVWVSWDPQAWRLEVRLPEKVTAVVVLPEAFEGTPAQALAPKGVTHPLSGREFRCENAGEYLFTPSH